jgi:DNA modification methylase
MTDKPTIELRCGDCLEVLRTLPADSIDCCVTSPPYWGLRNYQVDGQLGLEKTPEEYVAKMVEVFREVRRVLKKEGTLWLNLGDSYASGLKGSGGLSEKQLSNAGSRYRMSQRLTHGLKPKDLVGIPWRVAFALQADGWWLRQDIIWAKPNPMPESCRDRCTKSHEYIFLLTKAASYYFDNEAIKEDSVGEWNSAEDWKARQNLTAPELEGTDRELQRTRGYGTNHPDVIQNKRNKRSVWTVNVETNNAGHYATYPEELIRPCILAGCPEGGMVLDPFAGTATTGIVCKQQRKSFIGIEISPAYLKLAKRRIDSTEWGMFE